MGTRAVIRFGYNRIATHWDGDPDSLGKDLIELENKTLDNIIEVAEKHTIDFIRLSLEDHNKVEKLQKRRIEKLIEDGRLVIKDGKLYHTSSIISARDHPIGDFEYYDDYAEFEYLIESDIVFYRSLHTSYRNALKKNAPFENLTSKYLESENPSLRETIYEDLE